MTGKIGDRLNTPLMAFACIAVLGLLVYGQTLHVPWYFDDFPNIVENPLIRDLEQATRNLIAPGRGLVYWTFALNYRLGGFDVTGYHLVNIAIHLASAGLIFLLLRRLISPSSWLPLLGALIFLVHPLQTQAVTYIIQRMTSLSGFCFFLALYLFIRGRETLALSGDFFSRRHLLFYLAALGCGAVAVLTKQNAAILPLALLLWDGYFLPDSKEARWNRRILYTLPFLIVPLGLGAQQILIPLLQGAGLPELTRVSASGVNSQISQRALAPLNYLVTEFSVLWLYIRLLFLPYGQALDYSYPIATTLLTGKNLLALSGLGGLFALTWAGRKRLPLVSFGIFWFFLTLSVESTLIPLDPIFEHRLYVPTFGFVLVLLGTVQALLPPSRRQELVLFVLVVVFGVIAWQRNALWNDPIALYETNLRRAPWSERVNVALAKFYMDAGRYDDAIPVLQRALELNPGYVNAYLNLSVSLIEKGEYSPAKEALLRGLQLDPANLQLNESMASLYERQGQTEQSIRYLKRVLAIDPSYAPAYLYLGLLHAQKGELEQALTLYRQSITLFDRDPRAHYELGVVLCQLHEPRLAQGAFRRATQLDPNEPDALFNLSLLSLQLGEREEALAALPRLQELNAPLAEKLRAQLAAPR